MDIKNKVKIIILITPSSVKKSLVDSLLLINSIFNSDFNANNLSSDLFPSQKVYYSEYLSSNKDIRVIHYPQRFSLSQSDLNSVSKRLNLV